MPHPDRYSRSASNTAVRLILGMSAARGASAAERQASPTVSFQHTHGSSEIATLPNTIGQATNS